MGVKIIEDKIVIIKRDRILYVSLQDILFIERLNQKTLINTIDQVIPINLPLKMLTEKHIWSNANFRDAFPMVQSTLFWGITRIVTQKMIGATFKEAGYTALPGLQYTRLFKGRVYMNISLLQWEYYDAFGFTPRETNEFIGGHQPEIEIPESEARGGLKTWKKQWRKLRLLLATKRVERKARQTFAEARSLVGQYLKRDWKGLSDLELTTAINEINEISIPFAQKAILLNNSPALPLRILVASLEKFFPGKGYAMANALLVGQGGITSADHGYRLVEMAEMARKDPDAIRFFISEPFDPLSWKVKLPEESAFKQAFKAFLDEYGHRGVYEVDTINPRWKEDPSYLLNFIRGILDTSDACRIKSQQREKRDKVWQEINRKVPLYRRKAIKWWASKTVKGSEMRETAKSEMVRLGELSRTVDLEIGRRLRERGILDRREDVFHCSWSDLAFILTGCWDGRGLKPLVARRRERRKEYETLSPPDLIIGETPRYAAPAPETNGEALAGLGVAAGKASGRAKLIHHPNEGVKLNQGEVLVAPSTDPGWTPLFLKASAIGLFQYREPKELSYFQRQK